MPPDERVRCASGGDEDMPALRPGMPPGATNGHGIGMGMPRDERGWHATVVRRERGYVSRRIVRAFGRLIRFGFGECLMVTQRDE
jgi:hypothetical protein